MQNTGKIPAPCFQRGPDRGPYRSHCIHDGNTGTDGQRAISDPTVKRPKQWQWPPQWTFIWMVILLLGTTSCSVFRGAPEAPRWAPEEYRQYERQLGMPLTGYENPDLIKTVAAWIGTPYRFGGITRQGADCSGFVWVVYRDVYGKNLPRTTRAMDNESRRIRRRNLSEGDLVFFRTKGLFGVSHVGIYLGSGYFAHSSASRGVIVNHLGENYYDRRFRRGGRIR